MADKPIDYARKYYEARSLLAQASGTLNGVEAHYALKECEATRANMKEIEARIDAFLWPEGKPEIAV